MHCSCHAISFSWCSKKTKDKNKKKTLWKWSIWHVLMKWLLLLVWGIMHVFSLKGDEETGISFRPCECSDLMQTVIIFAFPFSDASVFPLSSHTACLGAVLQWRSLWPDSNKPNSFCIKQQPWKIKLRCGSGGTLSPWLHPLSIIYSRLKKGWHATARHDNERDTGSVLTRGQRTALNGVHIDFTTRSAFSCNIVLSW